MGSLSFALSERLAKYDWHAQDDGVAYAFDPKGEHGEFSFCGMPMWIPLGNNEAKSLCRDCTRRIDFLEIVDSRMGRPER